MCVVAWSQLRICCFLVTLQESIHSEFIAECFERLYTSYDTLQCLTKDAGHEERSTEANRMIRVLTVLQEYISECDEAYSEERALLSLSRYTSYSQQNH